MAGLSERDVPVDVAKGLSCQSTRNAGSSFMMAIQFRSHLQSVIGHMDVDRTILSGEIEWSGRGNGLKKKFSMREAR